MTTRSLPWTLSATCSAPLCIALGLVAIFTALGGIYWDVTWHATIGRDSFWIPPHLLVYAGITCLLLSALGGFTLTWRRVGRFRSALANPVGCGFVIAALGTLTQILAAPLDDLWHRLYGLDVTIWSPPHLMGIAGGMVSIYGLLAALGGALSGRDSRPVWHGLAMSEVLGLLLFSAALLLSLFALSEMDFHLERRDVLLYPLLAGALAAVPLMGAARYLKRPGAATVVALVYTLCRSLILLIIWAMGSTDHLTPPVFVLAPAVAIDLVLQWSKQHGVCLAALCIGPALLMGEWGYRAVFGAPAWAPLQVVSALTVVAVAVAVGGLAGDRLATLLRGE